MIEANKLTLPTRQPIKSKTPKRIAFLLLILSIGSAYYYYKNDIHDLFFETKDKKAITQKVIEQEQPFVQEVAPQELISKTPIEQTTKVNTTNLDTSDLSVEQKISNNFNSPLWLEWFGGEHIIRKTVAFIDNASRGELARKVVTLPIPNRALELINKDSNRYLNQQDFSQYETYVTMISAINPVVVQQLYEEFKPMLEDAYSELGNPDKSFDQALSETFQVLLDTPNIENQAMITRVGGRTMFVDERIENLPDIQKLLIRIGPSNRAIVIQKVLELKAVIF